MLRVSSEQPNDIEEVLGRSNEFGSLPSYQLPVPVSLISLHQIREIIDFNIVSDFFFYSFCN